MSDAILKGIDASGTYNARDVTEYLKSMYIRGERPDSQTLVKALVAALANFPTRDFALFLSFVPLNVQDGSEAIRHLKEAENELERCCFAAFWKLWAKIGASLPAVPGFEDKVRSSMVNIVLDSVLSMDNASLAAAFNVQDVPAFLKSKNVPFKIEGQNVLFEPNQFNSPVPSSQTTEKLTLKQVLSIVTPSQWSV